MADRARPWQRAGDEGVAFDRADATAVVEQRGVPIAVHGRPAGRSLQNLSIDGVSTGSSPCSCLALRSRAWRWSPASGSYGVVVSSGGNLAGSVVPTGVMPALPTTALLARDVEIDWSGDGGLGAAVQQRQALGHDVRFGPFRLTRASVLGDHISMKDPQLFGFLSEVLPRSPDPDLRLPWPRH